MILHCRGPRRLEPALGLKCRVEALGLKGSQRRTARPSVETMRSTNPAPRSEAEGLRKWWVFVLWFLLQGVLGHIWGFTKMRNP